MFYHEVKVKAKRNWLTKIVVWGLALLIKLRLISGARAVDLGVRLLSKNIEVKPEGSSHGD